MQLSGFHVTVALKSILLAVFSMPQATHADSGFYIGGSAGGATVEANLDAISFPGLPSSIDEDDTAWKLFAGYRFDLPVISVSVEAGYVDFGEADVDVLGEVLVFDTTGINTWGIASLDVGLFDVFGKLGVIAWDAEATFLDNSASEDGFDLGYGLGLGFEFGPLLLRGEYELYDLDSTDVSMLSLGVAYQFN